MKTPLSDVERALYEARLIKAQTARHDIMIGQGVKRYIDQNGEQVEYSVVNMARLENYIRELQELLNPDLACRSAPRPLRFVF